MPRAFLRSGLLLTAAVLSASCVESPAAPGSIDEVDPAPRSTMSTPSFDRGFRVAMLPNGSFAMIGQTDSALDGPSHGGPDIFVRRYHAEGELIWGRQFGSSLGDSPFGVASGPDGSVYVVVQTSGSIAGTRGAADGVVRAYDVDGNVLWTRQFGTPGDDAFTGVAVGADGSIYVGGYVGGDQSPAEDLSDAILRKYNAAGDVVWSRTFGTDSADAILSVAIGDSGAILVSGITGGSMRGANKGEYDAFVRRYTPDGTATWTRQEGSGANDMAWSVAADDLGRIHVGGETFGSLFNALSGPQDAFYWRLTVNGANTVTEQFGTTGADRVVAIAVDGSRNVYLAGGTDGGLDGPPAGMDDAFVRKYLPSAAVAWTQQIGTDSSDSYVGVAAATPSAIFVAGGTSGVLGSANAGGHDAFVRRLDSNGNPVWTDQ